jgi:hypothetical protein
MSYYSTPFLERLWKIDPNNLKDLIFRDTWQLYQQEISKSPRDSIHYVLVARDGIGPNYPCIMDADLYQYLQQRFHEHHLLCQESDTHPGMMEISSLK